MGILENVPAVALVLARVLGEDYHFGSVDGEWTTTHIEAVRDARTMHYRREMIVKTVLKEEAGLDEGVTIVVSWLAVFLICETNNT